MMSKRDELRKRRQAMAREQRYWLVGLVTVTAILVVAFLIWPKAAPTTDYSLADGKAIGPRDAKVVVQLFSDFQCPYCRQFAEGSEIKLLDQYIRAGKSVRLEYKHFIVIDGNVGGSESRHAAEASECAAEQGRFWQYHDVLYSNVQGEGTGSLRDDRLRAFAKSIGLDTAKFGSCFDLNRYTRNVTDDEALGRQLGVTGTPGIFVNGARVYNFANFSEIAGLVDAALSQ